jgi:single-strand DNA-binding protein
LTKDSELSFTAGKGTARLTFTLAVDDGFGDNKKTYYLPVVVWGKNAENLANYLVKGTQVAVSGKITTRSYDNKEGKKVYVTEIVADNYDGIKILSKGQEIKQQAEIPMDAFGGGFEEELIIDDSNSEMPF